MHGIWRSCGRLSVNIDEKPATSRKCNPQPCTPAARSNLESREAKVYLQFNGNLADLADADDEQRFPIAVRVWAANTLGINVGGLAAKVFGGSIVVELTITAAANEVIRLGDNEALARKLVRVAGESSPEINGRQLLAAELTMCFEGFDRCGRCGGNGAECADADNFMLGAGVQVLYNGTTEWAMDVGNGSAGFLRPQFLVDGAILAMGTFGMFQTTDTAGTLLFDLGAVKLVSEVRVVWLCNPPQEWRLAVAPVDGSGFDEFAKVKHPEGANHLEGASDAVQPRLDVVPLQGTTLRTLQINLVEQGYCGEGYCGRYCGAEVMVFGPAEQKVKTVTDSNVKRAGMLVLWMGTAIAVVLVGSQLIPAAYEAWRSRPVACG